MESTATIKKCPRCQGSFACNAGNIFACQCAGIVLSDVARAHIREQYTDCLCIRCLCEINEQESNGSSPS